MRAHNHLVRKRTLNHLTKLVSLAKWLSLSSVYELGGCRFESGCCHLNFRYRSYFEQGDP